jgi:hypothetical protein
MCTPRASGSAVLVPDWAGLGRLSGEWRIGEGRSPVRVPPRAQCDVAGHVFHLSCDIGCTPVFGPGCFFLPWQSLEGWRVNSARISPVAWFNPRLFHAADPPVARSCSSSASSTLIVVPNDERVQPLSASQFQPPAPRSASRRAPQPEVRARSARSSSAGGCVRSRRACQWIEG